MLNSYTIQTWPLLFDEDSCLLFDRLGVLGFATLSTTLKLEGDIYNKETKVKAVIEKKRVVPISNLKEGHKQRLPKQP